MPIKPTKFITSDTSLAAWLIVNNTELIEVDTTSKPAIYTLSKPPEELLLDWDTDAAFGNCAKFYKTYRSLLKRVMRNTEKSNG